MRKREEGGRRESGRVDGWMVVWVVGGHKQVRSG